MVKQEQKKDQKGGSRVALVFQPSALVKKVTREREKEEIMAPSNVNVCFSSLFSFHCRL
jgi:hypothetical protein